VSARAEILGRLAGARAGVAAAARPPPPASPPGDGLAARFATATRAADASFTRVTSDAEVAEAIAGWLESAGLPPVVCLGAGTPGLRAGSCGRLLCESRAPRDDGDALVCGCVAAVAEEGVVVLASGPAHASETAFLAASLAVVVRESDLVASLAGLWPRLRALGTLPRMVNLVRGPSRTADLGVPSRLGAHGPLRVHVILVAGAAAR
jgi:L-lactate dehydrogenase complex protein LldG